MESQFSNKLSQSGAQNTIHQQRIDEMDATVQKALLRSKRLEDERHNFHSRLIETHKEVSLLKVSSTTIVYLSKVFIHALFIAKTARCR
jgi:hypothetical protein